MIDRERTIRRRKVQPWVAVVAGQCLLLAGCREEQPDAYGTFEATEVTVSAEVGGRLVQLDVAEGQRLGAGVVVGQVDATLLGLQREELVAQRAVAQTRTVGTRADVGVLQAQLATAQSELARTQRLYNAEAATAQQLDRAGGEVRTLTERIVAARAHTGVAQEEAGGTEARIAHLDEQIRRGRIENPVAGTVLTSFANPGEIVQPGQPLYRIADLDTLVLRAYVSGAQLAEVGLGSTVGVAIDAAEGELLTLPGTVTWVAEESEFTPTPIQTRDERTNQVYAIEIRVPNLDGRIKIGMPGEVVFRDE